MELISVLAAAAASYIFGAFWYMTMAKPWVAASGVETDAEGQPANRSKPMPYVLSLISAILVAGMMRHVFGLSGVDSLGQGALAGFGIGLFMASPWIVTNYGFAGRSATLTAIDCGYATFGCTIMGAVLTLV